MRKLSLLISLICFFYAKSNAQSPNQCFYYEQLENGKKENITITIIIVNDKIDVHIIEIDIKGDFPNNGTQDIRHAEMQGTIEDDKISMKISESANVTFEKNQTEINRLKKEKVWLYKEDSLVIDGTVFRKVTCNDN